MADSASPPSPEPWYAPGLRFECTQCGNCCTGPSGFVWFSDEEAAAIAAHLGVTEAEFRQRFAHREFGRWTLNEIKLKRGQYDCVFLRRDDTGKALCSIYPVRPTQCRTWPFWPGNVQSPQAWQRAARNCPGMKQGDNFYPVENIRIILESNPDGL
ncbi:MAG: YkgJ family cysteine cluster protein [Phycisphaeraceae bacterium]